MGHQPTIFYILENQILGTWWVGKIESTLDGYVCVRTGLYPDH